jgi:hypothetical protein
MNLGMLPTLGPELREGTRVDVSLGLNDNIPTGALAGHRIAVEMSLPALQNLSGP